MKLQDPQPNTEDKVNKRITAVLKTARPFGDGEHALYLPPLSRWPAPRSFQGGTSSKSRLGRRVLLGLILLTGLPLLAAEDKIGTISKDIGLQIDYCHPGDVAIVKLTPLDPAFAMSSGWFTTTNAIVCWQDLSMMPEGTNRMEIRTICRGATSEVRVVTFKLERPPSAPKVRYLRLIVGAPTPGPPVPPGMIVALPDDQSRAYVLEQAGIQAALRRQHRSQ